jgi:hypothetical protein
MEKIYRQLMFKNALDYIRGKSNVLVTWPRWSMTDIHDFWNDKWEGESESDPGPIVSPDRTT